MMKLGILGAGMIVREFLPWLTGPESPFKVEALCSTERSAEEAQALCGQYGVAHHTTRYDELLSWVDVVYIAVPNILHVKYTRAALEAGRHVIVEKPMAPTAAQAEELAELARSKKLFLFEAVTTQYQDNYAKLREMLPKVGAVTMVQCNFSQYSSRYDDFCIGRVWPSFDPACAGGALMDLGVYNVSYVVGLFGAPNKVHYAANIARGIDTSGVLTMEYRSFKAVLQKSTANFCGGVTFHPYRGREEHFNLSAGRPRQAAEFHAIARAIESGDQELCSRMLDTSVAVSRVLETARRDAGIRFPSEF